MRRFLLAFVCLVAPLWAANTTVTDNLATIASATGGTITGVTINWPAFITSSSVSVNAGRITVPPSNFTVSLPPNVNSGALYTFTFTVLPSGSIVTRTYAMNVVVGYSATPLTIAQCQILNAPWYTGASGIPVDTGSGPSVAPTAVVQIANGGTGAVTASSALAALGGVTAAQVTAAISASGGGGGGGTPAWSAITGKPTFATVATSGLYTDLSGRPTIPTVPTVVSAFTNDAGYLTGVNWSAIAGKPTFATVATSGLYNDLSGKPTIPVVPTLLSAFTNDTGFLTAVNWAGVTSKPTFATVATSGLYSDLSGRPSIPTVPTVVSAFTNDAGYLTSVTSVAWSAVTSKPAFATVATSGAYADLTGRPTLATVAGTGAYADLLGKPTIPTVPTVVSAFTNDSGYLTSVAWSTVTGKPTFATVATSGAYTDLTGKPTIPTVPTAVSAFTNDSGYLTSVPWSIITSKPSFATIATSGAYSDLTGRPTIPTVPTLVSAFTNDASYATTTQLTAAQSASLAIPGVAGIVKATGTGSTTAVATPGTDYYAPGSQIAWTDMPYEVKTGPDPALLGWFSALHNASSQAVNVVVLGDSTYVCTQADCSVGPSSSANVVSTFLANQLQNVAGYGNHGTGIIAIQVNGGAVVGGSPRAGWTFSNGASTSNVTQVYFGPYQNTGYTGGTTLRMSSSARANLAAQFGDTLRVYGATYTDSASGCNVAIDGSSVGTFGAATTSSYTAVAANFTPANGLYGSHVVSITGPASGACYLYGAEWTAGTTGVSIHNMARGGFGVYGYGSDTANQLAYMNRISGSLNLVIDGLGINDANSNMSISGTLETPTQYQSYHQAIITYAKSINAQVSVLLVEPWVTPIQANSTHLTQAQIHTALQALVAANTGVTLVSMAERWGSTTTNEAAYGLVGGDNTHQTDAGAEDFGSVLAQRLIDANRVPPLINGELFGVGATTAYSAYSDVAFFNNSQPTAGHNSLQLQSNGSNTISMIRGARTDRIGVVLNTTTVGNDFWLVGSREDGNGYLNMSYWNGAAWAYATTIDRTGALTQLSTGSTPITASSANTSGTAIALTSTGGGHNWAMSANGSANWSPGSLIFYDQTNSEGVFGIKPQSTTTYSLQMLAGNTIGWNTATDSAISTTGSYNTYLSRPVAGVILANGTLASAVNSVTFSATPTFDLSKGNTQSITLTGNVTSLTLSNITAGVHVAFHVCQDATGSRTFVWPAAVHGGMTIGATASKCNDQLFVAADTSNLFALSTGSTNQ